MIQNRRSHGNFIPIAEQSLSNFNPGNETKLKMAYRVHLRCTHRFIFTKKHNMELRLQVSGTDDPGSIPQNVPSLKRFKRNDIQRAIKKSCLYTQHILYVYHKNNIFIIFLANRRVRSNRKFHCPKYLFVNY